MGNQENIKRMQENDVEIEIKDVESKRIPEEKIIQSGVPQSPSNSYVFQKDWRTLRKSPKVFYEYFKKISPETYAKIFGASFETDVLSKIIHILKEFYMTNGDDVLSVLQALPSVKRFYMAVMFLSESDKQAI